MSQPYKGWEYGPANSDDEGKLVSTNTLKKYGRTRPADGYNAPVKVVTVVNPETGAYDVYKQNAIGPVNFNRTLVYRFNPSNESGENIIIQSESDFNAIFGGAEGEKQLDQFNRSTKKAVVKNLQLLGALDPEIQDDLNNIRETNGYKSQTNTALEKEEEDSTEDGSTDAETDVSDKNANKDKVDPKDITTLDKVNRPLEIGDKKGTRTSSYGSLIYPIDLGSTTQDVIKFSMLKYIPSDVISGTSGALSFNADRGFDGRQVLGSVILPIPGGIKDDNRVNWTPANANALEIALANLALNTIARGQEGATASIKQIVDALQGKVVGNDTRTAVATAIAGQASGLGGQLITRTTGAVLNPNMELLFNGPSLRAFTFQFVLSAREPAEAREIVKILRFFKQGSSVKRTEGNLFLKSPHTFRIQYLHRQGADNPFMNRIKEVACTGVSVDYTPQNNYAPFEDGAMTSYGLTLNFQELTPVFDDEYGENSDNIGF